MKFTRKLTHEEIRSLSKEEDIQYIKWHSEQGKLKLLEERRDWTFENYCDYEFTMNNFAAARRDHFLEEELIDQKIKKRLGVDGKEDFTFFWETKSPFSQWYKCQFIAPAYMFSGDFKEQLIKNGFPREIKFSSTEQYMMYCKAMLFIDIDTAKEILKTNNVKEIKGLGRKVKGFNENTWYVYRWQLVYQGNKYKFLQNEDLKKALFATTGTTLVEASPNDKIWGIGLSENDVKAQNRDNWDGLNLLGEILTELRIELSGKY